MGRQTRADREARPAPVRADHATRARRADGGSDHEPGKSLALGEGLRRSTPAARPSQRGRAVGRATEATVAAAPVHRGHGAAPAPLVRRDQQRGRRIQRHPAIPARRRTGGGRRADDHVRQLAGRADDRPDERRHRYGVRPDGAGGRRQRRRRPQPDHDRRHHARGRRRGHDRGGGHESHAGLRRRRWGHPLAELPDDHGGQGAGRRGRRRDERRRRRRRRGPGRGRLRLRRRHEPGPARLPADRKPGHRRRRRRGSLLGIQRRRRR